MTNLIQTLISGLSLGSIYALIALGYTMVYGIAKMLNFAHGDVIMVGAYSGIVAVAQMGLSPWVTVIVSIVVCAVLGVVIEFCAYKPLRQAPPLSVLITAIGVSYLLQNAALLIFGSQQMAYPTLVKLPGFTVGGVQVDGITVLTLGERGVVCAAGETTLRRGIYRVNTVDTTAAGDTFCGYFLAGVAAGSSLEDCLRQASLASALAVTAKGAAPSIPTKQQVEQFEASISGGAEAAEI